MSKKSKSLADQIFCDLESLRVLKDREEKRMIGVWLPESYKERFDILQEQTNAIFGKKLQELIMQAIDQVEGKL